MSRPSKPDASVRVEFRHGPWLVIRDESDPLNQIPDVTVRAISDRVRSMSRGMGGGLPRCRIDVWVKTSGRPVDVDSVAAWVLWLIQASYGAPLEALAALRAL